jgi:predicted nuclease of predicted toxin-antitoxin system
MKLLVDAQLPIRLANHLRQMGVEVLHTSELPLRNRTPDAEIKHLSITQEYVIVTKDGDFVDNLLLHQNLHKLLLVATGNITNSALVELFTRHWREISDGLLQARFVELVRDGVVIHW